MQIPFRKFTSLRDQQKIIIDAGLASTKKILMLNAPTGCHLANTPIMMFDRSIKKVQDIVVNDLLMGGDGFTSRKVLCLHRGKQDMYEIIPVNSNWKDSFVVNKDHVLSLKKIDDKTVLNISVAEYILKSQDVDFRIEYELYRRINFFTDFSRFAVRWHSKMNDYYGFEIDGDHLYCMGDGTVTHNSGKSLANMMLAHNTADKSLYVCSSKMLQDQLVHDFPEAEILKGRSNYQCNLHKSLTADSCLKLCSSYKKKSSCNRCGSGSDCQPCEYNKIEGIDCSYYDQKLKVVLSKYGILNTHYYLTETNFVGSFDKYKTVIIDEADTLDETLTNFISFSIYPKTLEKYELELPKFATKLESWTEWAKHSQEKISNKIKNYLWVTKIPVEKRKQYENDIKEFNYLKNIESKIGMLVENVGTGWLFDHKDKFEFAPIWLTPQLAQRYLWSHAERFLLSSATLHKKPIMAKILGLDIADVDYNETDCPFPVENRRVIYEPIVALSKKAGEEEENKLIDKISETINYYKGVRGIVHAVSYRLAEKITRANKRCITHDSRNKDIILSDFFKSKDLVFVSPSSEHGLDLKDDLARFCIWAKVPFPNLNDKRVSARLYGSGKFGQEWYLSTTAQKFIQGAGRGVRSMDDFCDTIIFDSKFDKIIPFFPSWFTEAIETKW